MTTKSLTTRKKRCRDASVSLGQRGGTKTGTRKDQKIGSGRRAAQNHDFDESKIYKKNEFVEKMAVIREKKCKKEQDALEETSAAAAVPGSAVQVERRRIHDFAVVDSKENGEPLESLAFLRQKKKSVFLSGVVYPISGPLSKSAGRRVTKPFGPVTGYSVDLVRGNIIVKTSRAEYVLLKPTAAYKKWFDNLAGQVAIASEVYQSISTAKGGIQSIGMDHVITHLARCKVTKEFSSPREGLLINGAFILDQLGRADPAIESSQFFKELSAETASYVYLCDARTDGIRIKRDDTDREDRRSGRVPRNSQEAADQLYAMQLQAKIDKEANAGRSHVSSKDTQEYIKVNEEEIAGDYPLPTLYIKDEEELDEFLLYDEELETLIPEDMPKRILTDYSIYNTEGFMTSLELLPMWSGVDPDVELYASGLVVEDESGSAQVAAGEGTGSSAGKKEDANNGMRMSLSQIREWVVELGPDMVFISLRTDIGWYSLAEPSPKYKPWSDVVMRCARVAGSILQMICEESRASKLSFNDIVRRICKEPEDSNTYISAKPALVERFLSVHAQIFLSCFQHFPSEPVRKCAFLVSLREKLNSVKHSKLYVSSSRGRGRMNRNPMRDRAAGARAKPMTATATRMVKHVWQSYFTSEEASESSQDVAHIVEEDENEENEDEATETALANQSAPFKANDNGVKDLNLLISKFIPKNGTKMSSWVLSKPASGSKVMQEARVGNTTILLGDCVVISDVDNYIMGVAQSFWENKKEKLIQIRVLKQGYETVLGDAASEEELFLTQQARSFKICKVVGKVNANRQIRQWETSKRIEYFSKDVDLRERNARTKSTKKGSLEFFWSKQYVPEEGMFKDIGNIELGTILKEDDTDEGDDFIALTTDDGVVIDGISYRTGQFVYVYPDVFDQMPEAVRKVEVPSYVSNARFHKGSHGDLRAWGIGRLMKVGKKSQKIVKPGQEVDMVILQRFWRPEDISIEKANAAKSYYDVYAGDEEIEVDVTDIVGPVNVGPINHQESKDSFQCVGSFQRKSRRITNPPKDLLDLGPNQSTSTKNTLLKKNHGKNAGVGPQKDTEPRSDSISLSTMDIFAGCGGLSEGMHQARAAVTKWAIEYEQAAADSFKLNNPESAVFCNNCNVLLHAAMVKFGQEGDCMASEEAIKQSNSLSSSDKDMLPKPGEVDFICGGPPCQGYSGMNRFNKGNWSMVQNSMVMSFLSYADFYRPRYFLLENVRNFVSHNKSFTFRLTLRSLLDMGYQVRFGVLNAGNFGVSQSRKRTFIWAAAPSENLPSWPRLMHCFRTPQLTINLPGNVQYTAVPQTDGAPLRPVTVHDAISDLPPIANGHDVEEALYTTSPSSAFQLAVRGNCNVLYDHVCKHMNELNMERCRCIPKNCPGADWRVLEEIVAKDPTKKNFNGQPLVPWCLPNTAERHNGWRGLFGRLDWLGHFPTSTTDPQPMGKVGQVFHPEQDRIVSVRECARAQGFPDRHRFVGNVQNKHRQVGNAVPPPLAAALGRELRLALEEKENQRAKDLLHAMSMT